MCWLWLGLAAVASAQDRFALVIGNSRYDPEFLRNPVRDADAMEAALTPLGIKVSKYKDLDKEGMETALWDFQRTLTKGSAAVFFYAGHGLQVQGENYLMPVKVEVEEQYEVRHRCFPVSLVMGAFQESGSNLKVIVLELVEVFREASRAVKKETDQVPWLNMEASLEKFYLWTAPATASGADSSQGGTPAAKLPGMRPTPPIAPALEPLITNSIGMQLKLIPAGEFLMGSPDTEAGRYRDESPHRVRITRPFYLGVYEVTQPQYEAVMEKNPSYFRGSDLPVERVSWEDAVEFCRRLSIQEGRMYRLPTEAEWEYACRAGTTTPFAFGETIVPAE